MHVSMLVVIVLSWDRFEIRILVDVNRDLTACHIRLGDSLFPFIIPEIWMS